MRYPAIYWKEKLHLQSHVEGGAFSEIYRSALILQPGSEISLSAPRNISTNIYFLLEKGQISAFHRIRSDELWHFYAGDPLQVFELLEDGGLITHTLGNDPEKGEAFCCVIKAGNWFASSPAPGSEYSLCGCTVAPGFDFADFEMAIKNDLLMQFPQHQPLIEGLTRD